MEVPVQISVRGKNILGVFHIAERNADGLPTIVLCYGLNGNRVENHRMSVIHGRYAEEAGVNLLRFDYRGLGVSEGEFWEASIRTKTEDILAAIDFAKGCSQKRRNTLILLGFSDGGRVALDAARLCKGISGICMWNPVFFPIPIQNSSNKATLRMVREPKTREFVFPFEGLWGGLEHFHQQKDIGTAFQDFINFEGRKLAIFGSEDTFTLQSREELIKANSNTKYKSEIVTLQGVNHLFNHTKWVEEVIRKTIKWAIEVGKINSI